MKKLSLLNIQLRSRFSIMIHKFEDSIEGLGHKIF